MSHWDLDTTRTRPDVTKTHPNAVIGPIPAELGTVISMCSGCARSFVERERCDRSDTNVVFLLATATERAAAAAARPCCRHQCCQQIRCYREQACGLTRVQNAGTTGANDSVDFWDFPGRFS